jgi:hypothetical protein
LVDHDSLGESQALTPQWHFQSIKRGDIPMKIQTILFIFWIVVMVFLLANWFNKPYKPD